VKNKSLGEIAYDGYLNAILKPGQSYESRWETPAMDDNERKCWESAAIAVMHHARIQPIATDALNRLEKITDDHSAANRRLLDRIEALERRPVMPVFPMAPAPQPYTTPNQPWPHYPYGTPITCQGTTQQFDAAMKWNGGGP
jgi:hypothetical protein